jgi:uncharacterized GH25 family protein
MNTLRNSFFLSSTLLLFGAPLFAHDFWIEPSVYRAKQGDEISLTLRVGEDLQGDTLPYINDWFSDYRVVSDSGERPVQGLMGDDPAGRFIAEEAGLHMIGYRSTNNFVELESGKFHDYLAKEGLEFVVGLRQRRGEGDSTGREEYSRCAKALISVGNSSNGNIFSQPLGYTLEIIPDINPYSMTVGDVLPIRVQYLSEPIAGILVVAFNQADPAQKVSARTNDEGRVDLKLGNAGVWLVKAVHIIETPPANTRADWESFWASLIFRLDP